MRAGGVAAPVTSLTIYLSIYLSSNISMLNIRMSRTPIEGSPVPGRRRRRRRRRFISMLNIRMSQTPTEAEDSEDLLQQTRT